MTECRHGFDEELCDICSPRQTAAPVRTTPAPRRAPVSKARERVAPTSLRTPSAKTSTSAAAPEPRTDTPFAQRRLFHVTHIDNLAGILADGAIVAGAVPDVDLLEPSERAAIAERELLPGASLTGFVPFVVSPDGLWWNDLRSGAADERHSRAARTASASDFVVLVATTVGAGAEIVVTDGPSGAEATRYGVGAEAAANLLRRASLLDPQLRRAEAYVNGRYAVADLAMIATGNEPARAEVKRLLGLAGVKGPRLAVFPPFFQPTEDDEEL